MHFDFLLNKFTYVYFSLLHAKTCDRVPKQHATGIEQFALVFLANYASFHSGKLIFYRLARASECLVS